MEARKNIGNKHGETPPRPATTPAMVQAFWLRLFRGRTCQATLGWLHGFGSVAYADPSDSPFVVRLHGNHAEDQRVAYLSVAGGRAEWRFGTKAMGYAHSPAVTDPDTMAWLDSLFWWYTATETQQRKRGRPTDLQYVVAERIRNMKKKQGTWKRNRPY